MNILTDNCTRLFFAQKHTWGHRCPDILLVLIFLEAFVPQPPEIFHYSDSTGAFLCLFSPQLSPYIFPPILTGTVRGQLYIAFQVETYIILILLIKKHKEKIVFFFKLATPLVIKAKRRKNESRKNLYMIPMHTCSQSFLLSLAH